jgi:hypothetical protein
MSGNLTYKKESKFFEDGQHRFKVDVEYGGINARVVTDGVTKTSYFPAVYVDVSLVPKEGEDVNNFVQRLGISEQYSAEKQKRSAGWMGRIFASGSRFERDTQQHGTKIVHYNSFDVMGVQQLPMTQVKDFIEQMNMPPISQNVFKAMDDYITERLSDCAMEEAKNAYIRTGGKGSSQIAAL